MISCGEASGDLYAGALAAELRRRVPGAEIFGFGGPELGRAGGELLGDFTRFSVTGLVESLRVIPRSVLMLRRLIDAARERRPDVFVPIDFPDFNFRLMGGVRRLGVPIVYYVSPQLWAWRPGRMKTMQASVDRVLVIFPFEEQIYKDAGVDVRFVGHPLIDAAKAGESRPSFLAARGLVPDAPTVALLPGSRRNEVEHTAPVFAEAMPLIRARVPAVQFTVACASTIADAQFAPLSAAGAALVRGRTDEVIASADVVITASGTATVQCAMHERPMVVVYRLSPLTYRLGKRFVNVDMYAMPNLVAGSRIVPELIQGDFTPDRVAGEVVALLTDRVRHAQMTEALRRVKAQMGSSGASARAAEAILEVAAAKRADRTAGGAKSA
ncbi:MAG: lipid-A-disaccharide synthase [Vicinamibacterales bacterium]